MTMTIPTDTPIAIGDEYLTFFSERCRVVSGPDEYGCWRVVCIDDPMPGARLLGVTFVTNSIAIRQGRVEVAR
jgi:hypothetical protein